MRPLWDDTAVNDEDEIKDWRTARACDGGACLEAGSGPGFVAVRDRALGVESPVLRFGGGGWAAFVRRLKAS